MTSSVLSHPWDAGSRSDISIQLRLAVLTINMSRPGSPKNKGNSSFAGFGEPRCWGDGHLCNSNNGFLENIAWDKMEGRAIRRGALSHTTYQIHVKFERHLDVASCRLPDDGARL
jgi:hypothetical protein